MNLEKYQDTSYGRILGRFAKMAQKGAEKGLEPDFIAKQIVDISEASKPKVRYTYVLNKLTNWFIPRIIPARMMDRLIKNRLMK